MSSARQPVLDVEHALALAWDERSARASLERWDQVCAQEGWGTIPNNRYWLARLFGASWYFTRVLFYQGQEAAALFDVTQRPRFSTRYFLDRLAPALKAGDIEQRMDRLTELKNRLMLEIYLADLRHWLGRPRIERALTQLADACIRHLVQIARPRAKTPTISVLGMGRMAGFEMNYGSDLDLIFLYHDKSPDAAPAVAEHVRDLVRHLAHPRPSGLLYEIDTRLRPHGTSGALVSSITGFLDYHSEPREIWERQVMTRCRAVLDPGRRAGTVLKALAARIYDRYDPKVLKEEIRAMRARVEEELGNPKGRYDIKKGRGGIMDVDFVAHYLQLLHGHEHAELQTTSTRTALAEAARLGVLAAHAAARLTKAYDFYKRLEGAIRVYDMKAVHRIEQEPHKLDPVARVMEIAPAGGKSPGQRLLQQYEDTSTEVRSIFESVLG